MEARSIIRLGSEVYMMDPCYNTLDVASGSGRKLQNVLPGDWVCGVEYHSMHEGKPCRVGSLYCWHSEHTDIDFSTDNMIYDGACGVDSGQLGIFDVVYFDEIENSGEKRKNEWYFEICRVTLDQDYLAGGKDDKCYVSSSGYGDGGYAVYVKRNEDGYIVAIRVPFIYGDSESDPEEEEEDYWDVDDYWNSEDDA